MMLWVNAAQAAEPTVELNAAMVLKLLALESENRTEPPVVALIQEGKQKDGDYEVEHVRRVVMMGSVTEGGGRVRRSLTRHFFWNEEQGWHLWECRRERGGEAIWIWSEKKGRQVIR